MTAGRILVIDDSSTVRRVVERTLAEAGFDVMLAADGREGLELASTKIPDLVLVDFVMPHMNGFQLVQAIRGIANLAHVPVVLMSAKADRIGGGFLSQTGALDAITKPFSPEALLAVATHALQRASTPGTEDAPAALEINDSGESALDLLAETRVAASPRSESRSIAEPSSPSTPIATAPAPQPDPEHADLARRIAGRIAAIAVDDETADPEALARRIETRTSPGALLALAGELADLVPSLRGEDSFSGRIEHVPLGEILQMLQHQRQTGVLEIRRGTRRNDRIVSVCMSSGSVDLALGRAQDEEFLLGRYLLAEELIERDALSKVIESRATTDRASARTFLGTRLVKLGYITQADLTRVLLRQTSELIYDALRWKRGTYRFARLATRAEASEARLGLPIGSILMEGLRRVDEWRLIEEQIHTWDDVLRVDREAIVGVDLDRFSREERTVLSAVDGTRSVRAIVAHTRMGSFEVSKILFQLLTSRLLKRVA
jgi:CheY-like chemotaxis protein